MKDRRPEMNRRMYACVLFIGLSMIFLMLIVPIVAIYFIGIGVTGDVLFEVDPIVKAHIFESVVCLVLSVICLATDGFCK